MNATKCKMILPTWLKINQSSKSMYKWVGLRSYDDSWILPIQISKWSTSRLVRRKAHESREQGIEHRTLTGSVSALVAQVYRVDSLNSPIIMLSKIYFSFNNQHLFHACIQLSWGFFIGCNGARVKVVCIWSSELEICIFD